MRKNGELANLSIDEITKIEPSVSCLLDEPYKKPIYCICDAYSSNYQQNTNQQHMQ